MPYLYKTTLTTPIDLGEVAYEALESITINIASATLVVRFTQYTSADVSVRQRAVSLDPPLGQLQTLVGQITTLARSQGGLGAGTDSVETVDE